jgi:hypothetical protein
MAECSGMGAERDRGSNRQVASRGVYRTERLRLVPIYAGHASELWELHQDEGIARWFPMSGEQALRFAERMENSWKRGVGKWLAYEKTTGAFIGRAVLGHPRGRGVRGDRLGIAPGSLGPRLRDRDRTCRPRSRVLGPRRRAGSLLHRDPQCALARGDGAPGDALRPPDPAAGSDRRIIHSARGGTVRALPDYPRRPRPLVTLESVSVAHPLFTRVTRRATERRSGATSYRAVPATTPSTVTASSSAAGATTSVGTPGTRRRPTRDHGAFSEVRATTTWTHRAVPTTPSTSRTASAIRSAAAGAQTRSTSTRDSTSSSSTTAAKTASPNKASREGRDVAPL